MNTRNLGPFTVSAIGLGCMNLSHAYGQPPPLAQAREVLLGALDRGVTLFDTAALYGFGANEELIAQILGPHRHRIVLATKGGMAGVDSGQGMRRVIDGAPATIRRNCEDSLRRLKTDHVDLYYLHRWDKQVPIEDSVGAMAQLVQAGKVRAIGLSEVSATTLRRAHAVHPIAAVQSEYSLWTRNPEAAVLPACEALGVTFVAFSPLARSFLTAAPVEPEHMAEGDMRRQLPRFSQDHWSHNRSLLPAYQALAAQAGCSPAQLALAWLLSRPQGVIPIPGTTRLRHLDDLVGAVGMQVEQRWLDQAQELIHPTRVHGERYGPQATSEVDSD